MIIRNMEFNLLALNHLLQRVRIPFLMGAGCLFLMGVPVCMGEVVLVRDNRAHAAIVIPDNPLGAHRLAAEELRYHVAKATGIELRIHKESEVPETYSNLVYIGPCQATANAGLNVEELPPSGYFIKTIGSHLYLAGKDRDRFLYDRWPHKEGVWASYADRSREEQEKFAAGNVWAANWQGTLYAVYDVLENELGVRWLWPGELGEHIPAQSEIAFDHLDRQGEPVLKYSLLIEAGAKTDTLYGWSSAESRLAFFNDQRRFLLRHRMQAVENFQYGHAFGNYWRRFGKSNPEFFQQLPDGRRGPLAGDVDGTRVTMCVSEPGLWMQIIKDWKRNSRRDPNNVPYQPYVNACENDTPGMCTSEFCREWDAKDPRFEENDYWGRGVIPALHNRFAALTSNATWGEGVPVDTGGAKYPPLSDRYAKFYMALLEEAKWVDPDARVVGYAYANYWNAPVETELDEDVIISFVPPLWFPYTKAMSDSVRKEWDGWRRAGLRDMIFRPNLTHAGANLPIFYAHELAADFSYCAERGMIGAHFDSLLGAWSVQGPTLYTLVRLQQHPDWPAEKILDEYYAGFGPAENAVRHYFKYWEDHS